MNRQDLKTAAVILGVVALCAFVQRNIVAIPVIGPYMPGGTMS
ncbi:MULTISPECIES: hypothetical protein [Burkholderiaceae]|nr:MULTISPECIES: hypothetical protein [Burkholderiaceae]